MRSRKTRPPERAKPASRGDKTATRATFSGPKTAAKTSRAASLTGTLLKNINDDVAASTAAASIIGLYRGDRSDWITEKPAYAERVGTGHRVNN